jgi:hypothetical protein
VGLSKPAVIEFSLALLETGCIVALAYDWRLLIDKPVYGESVFGRLAFDSAAVRAS